MIQKIKIELLADNPGFCNTIEEWLNDEWPRYYCIEGQTKTADKVRNCMNRKILPIGLVAIHDNTVCGSVFIIKNSISHDDLSPWLTSLYIKPNCRLNYIGSQLVDYSERLTSRLGYSKLFARSSLAAGFFLNLGWSVVDSIDYLGEDLTVFSKNI